jgi:hypothetical protein
MSGASTGQVGTCLALLAKLLENVTVLNGYNYTIQPESILYQMPPLVVKREPPIIYIYLRSTELEAGLGGRYNVDIQYSIIGEVGTTKGANDLLDKLTTLQSDLLIVMASDLYLINTATEQGTDVHLDHHLIYAVNTEEGLAYPKAMLEIQGGMHLHSTPLTLL